ncbi:MAG TPA: hypothetical protein VJ599_00920 [Nitrososphaeraceae archaeon]|jgi:hypothetical protein|nr:hypothetical protein [Nitrososphaeraceae archaeon]
MPGKYQPNKVPMESKVDARYPGTAHNERYLNVSGSGTLGNGVMGHASKTMSVDPCPNYDIGRMKYSDYQYKDTPMEAFNYKF